MWVHLGLGLPCWDTISVAPSPAGDIRADHGFGTDRHPCATTDPAGDVSERVVHRAGRSPAGVKIPPEIGAYRHLDRTCLVAEPAVESPGRSIDFPPERVLVESGY